MGLPARVLAMRVNYLGFDREFLDFRQDLDFNKNSLVEYFVEENGPLDKVA